MCRIIALFAVSFIFFGRPARGLDSQWLREVDRWIVEYTVWSGIWRSVEMDLGFSPPLCRPRMNALIVGESSLWRTISELMGCGDVLSMVLRWFKGAGILGKLGKQSSLLAKLCKLFARHCNYDCVISYRPSRAAFKALILRSWDYACHHFWPPLTLHPLLLCGQVRCWSLSILKFLRIFTRCWGIRFADKRKHETKKCFN